MLRLLSGIERYESANDIHGLMDDTDVKILNLLRDNSRMKNTEIARHVKLTERAVRARIEKLTRGGVIRKFTIETSPVGVEGLVLIDTNVGRTPAVKEKARELSDAIFECSGEFDVAVRLRADSLDELNKRVDELRAFPGVIRTSTLIKLLED
jgi:DNA-binding Lrp family transcriptional regulator